MPFIATSVEYTKIISSFNHGKNIVPNMENLENNIILSGDNPFSGERCLLL